MCIRDRYQRRVRGLCCWHLLLLCSLMGKWPASGKRDSQGRPLRPTKKTIKTVMARYDYDLSNTINEPIELTMLTINLAVELELQVQPDVLQQRAQEGVAKLGDAAWTMDQFSKWFFEVFNFSPQSAGSTKTIKSKQPDTNDPAPDDLCQAFFEKYDVSGTNSITSADELELLCKSLAKKYGTKQLKQAVPSRVGSEISASHDWDKHPWELPEFMLWFRRVFPELDPEWHGHSGSPTGPELVQVRALQHQADQLDEKCTADLGGMAQTLQDPVELQQKLEKANQEVLEAQLEMLEMKKAAKQTKGGAVDDARDKAPLFLEALQRAEERAERAESKIKAMEREYAQAAVQGQDLAVGLIILYEISVPSVLASWLGPD
eukprot:TRINITY_DN4209_c0_g1_i5.p1 TRINITY_DN4209_c0_g1~~TRINITY_DN4209_c0_g1_i5.p1  ORF type:complete len:389 (+),score=115.19 TRINITY_DN4209_c0_g1_i5:42-1169(+)